MKHAHLLTVALSYGLFFLRGLWMIAADPRLGARWTRVVPHVIDTVLLASAAGLAWQVRQFPFVDSWLTTKVLGLVAYIALGVVALRRGRTRAQRIGAWIAAQVVFWYIVAVALTRHPFPPVD
jgi:uncharacterized membrane protein SirB2